MLFHFRNYIYEVSLYGYDPSSYAAGSNSVALKLSAGDQIDVKLDGDSYLFGKPDQVYCTFSGYLVAPTQAGNVIIGWNIICGI